VPVEEWSYIHASRLNILGYGSKIIRLSFEASNSLPNGSRIRIKLEKTTGHPFFSCEPAHMNLISDFTKRTIMKLGYTYEIVYIQVVGRVLSYFTLVSIVAWLHNIVVDRSKVHDYETKLLFAAKIQ
jgi:hypothetical protein